MPKPICLDVTPFKILREALVEPSETQLQLYLDVNKILSRRFSDAVSEAGYKVLKKRPFFFPKGSKANVHHFNSISRKMPYSLWDISATTLKQYRCGIEGAVAINHRENLGHGSLSSVESLLKLNQFCFGNVGCYIESGDFTPTVIFSGGLEATGFSSQIEQGNKPSWVALIGCYFSNANFLHAANLLQKEHPTIHKFTEINVTGHNVPGLFECRYCGVIARCSCLQEDANAEMYLQNLSGYYGGEKAHVKDALSRVITEQNICHLCTKTMPILEYGSPQYYDYFMRMFLPYVEFAKKRPDLFTCCFSREDQEREYSARDLVRKRMGLKLTSEKWVREYELFRNTRLVLAPEKVIFHYRGKEMCGLEIDIFVPALNLAIEYQGAQHYGPIGFFGGQEAFLRQVERDDRKKSLCSKNEYILIEFSENDGVSIDVVRRKLRRYV